MSQLAGVQTPDLEQSNITTRTLYKQVDLNNLGAVVVVASTEIGRASCAWTCKSKPSLSLVQGLLAQPILCWPGRRCLRVLQF